MNCPACNSTMDEGELDLKAWGVGAAPQAQLHFHDELIMKDQYLSVVGIVLEGTKAAACRCQICKLISIQY